MKFYEINNPYYALVKAENEGEAIKEYTKSVADNDGSLHEEIKEVDREYALAAYSRGLSEDGHTISVNEILEDFRNGETMTLLVDGSLI